MMRKMFILICVLGSFFHTGCVLQPVDSSSLPTGYTSTQEGGASTVYGEDIGAYELRPLDPIFIRFSGINEQQQLELVIDENGEISLLHLPPIKAAGLTTSALEDKIEQLYVEGGIYKHASVNVTMTAKVFYVQGEVNAPGQFQLMSGTTLIQAIAGSRGYTAFANKKKVTVTRQGRVYTFNMKELEKDPSKDVKIQAGDVIKVWQSNF
jgi:protein involved in polysaccharide export with SLBB domain